MGREGVPESMKILLPVGDGLCGCIATTQAPYLAQIDRGVLYRSATARTGVPRLLALGVGCCTGFRLLLNTTDRCPPAIEEGPPDCIVAIRMVSTAFLK